MIRAKVTGEGAKFLEKNTSILYRKWIELKGNPQAGSIIHLISENGYEACGLWEPKGPVAVRVLYHGACPFTSSIELLEYRIRLSYRKREKARLAPGSYRLVNSDGDLLSGLIIDVFNNEVAVIQSSSIAMDAHIEEIADIIVNTAGLEHVYEKSTQRSRRDIGLEPRRRWLRGGKRRVIVNEGAARFIVDVELGQKTGFYLDQRPNRLELEKYVSEGDKVLDVFAYTGGFGIHAGLAGAKEVVFIEEDSSAAQLLKENLKLNGIRNYRIIVSSIWDVIDKPLGKEFNIVTVDPPAFIQSGDRASVRRGFKAYRSSYRWALENTSDEAIVYLSSCSYFLTRKRFLKVILLSMRDASRDYSLLGSIRGAGPDHTLRSESYLEYLKGAFIYTKKKGKKFSL